MATIINSESDAFRLLREIVEGSKIDNVEDIKFEEWPKFVIRIKGEQFNGTIPTRIMPSLLELQKELHKAYCLTVYGDENTRKLTKKDKEKLELVVKVDEGSSWFETLLNDKLTKIIQDAAGKMSPEQLVVVAIVFGVLIASTIGWKAWLTKKSKDKEIDAELEKTIELSRLEKEKLELISKASGMVPVIEAIINSTNNLKSDFATNLKSADVLEVGGSKTEDSPEEKINMTGELVSKLSEKPREKAVEKKVSGVYLLLSADFTDEEGLRVSLRRQDDGYEFKAKIPLGVIGDEQSEIIKEDSWNKKAMKLDILVKELHSRYTSATVVAVRQGEEG
jgi:hypothetical protein